MINLNRTTEDDAAALRQSRIVAFDANARAEKRKAPAVPKTHSMCAAMGRAYWAAEDVRMAREPAVPADAVSHRPGDPPMGGLAELAADLGAESQESRRLRFQQDFKQPQPDADGWIPFECTRGSICPVPPDVDFEIRTRGNVEVYDRRNEIIWRLTSTGEPWGCDVVAYRILPAKPAALPDWRRGPDVPESERKSGLWFVKGTGWFSKAELVRCMHWNNACEYRPAPPGVKEGDAYSPALYGEEA
jgi:hypothetical protein